MIPIFKLAYPASLRLFSVFTFLQQYNVKCVHQVSDTGIWTHDLLNMTLLP